MQKNKEILNKFENEIKGYKKLTLNEAQEIYTRLINCEDNKLKKQLRNELIMGTLYVIPEFINSKGLTYMNSTSYDMNDIINASIETWIRRLDSGILLNLDEFKKVFGYNFCDRMCENVGVKNDIKPIEYLNNIEPFMNLIIDYVRQKEKDENFDFYKLIENNEWVKRYIKNSNVSYFELLDAIIKSFELNGEKLQMTKVPLHEIRNLAINNGLEYSRQNIYSLIDNDLEEQFDKEQLKEELIRVINESSRLTNIEREILFKKYGLFDEPKSLTELAELYNTSPQYIYLLQLRAFRKIKNSNKAKQIKTYLYK